MQTDSHWMLFLTFGLLGLSVVAVWCPSLKATKRIRVAPWAILFFASTISAVIGGVITNTGFLVLMTFGSSCLASRITISRWKKILLTAIACLMALGLAFRLFPGFPDQILYDELLISPDASPFRLNLNFGKGCAGLFLLSIYSRRIRSWSELKTILKSKIWLVAIGTPLFVLSTALFSGGIRFNPKWPEPTLAFLASNLFFTCVAEESFFRGLLQEQLHKVFGQGKIKDWIPILLISLSFAALHLNANITYFLFVAVAGFGYSYAYFYFRRIEPAIVTHFLVNAFHFLLFTYPHIAIAA